MKTDPELDAFYSGLSELIASEILSEGKGQEVKELENSGKSGVSILPPEDSDEILSMRSVVEEKRDSQ